MQGSCFICSDFNIINVLEQETNAPYNQANTVTEFVIHNLSLFDEKN